MRKLFFVLFLVCSIGYSQVPQKMSHRGTAYNTSGQILLNTQIKVRVKIFEGSTSGTLLFEEIHNNNLNSLQTNQNGQYSIEIGNGTVQSGSFSSINWGSGQKWLEIGIASALNPTTFVTGSSQLMSVPYALYAEENNSYKIFENISELRNHVGTIGEVVYVKGHTTSGDGGGGNFIWQNHSLFINQTVTITYNNSPNQTIFSPYYEDNGGTVIQSKNTDGSFNNSGRWIRQFNGYIDVRYFGAFGLYSIDCTDQIQKALDFASANASVGDTPLKGTTVFLPNGGYIINKLIIKNGVSLIGDSMDKTYITSSNPSYSGYTNDGYLIEIDKGPIQINISNINFIGNGTDKGCFYFNAKYDSTANSGGIQYSTFKNLKITSFKGNGIYLKGGGENGENYFLPNQFLLFENVRVTRITNESNSLNITGLTGQITFLNCQFDGSKLNCSNTETCSRNLGSNVEIINNGDKSSSVISFINSTFQDSDIGLSMKSATNITVDNCWFESLGIAIKVVESSAVSILNSLFTNAAGFGYLTPQGNIQLGRCIDVTNSNVNILNNYVTVSILNSQSTDDYFLFSDNNSTVNLKNNSFLSSELGKTSGHLQTTSISSKALNIKSKKVLFVNVPSTYNTITNDLERINSDCNSGELIFIRTNGGSLKILTMNPTNESTGKNIYLNGLTSITLQNGQGATFIKIDNVVGNEKCTYQLVSTTEIEDINWNTSISFLNGVTNYDANSTLRCRKKNGVVYLDGAIKLGTTQTNGLGYKLFQLPDGYRPSRKCSFVITRANTTSTTFTVGRIDIDTDGWVYGVNYSSIWSSLSGISFVVD